MVTQRTIKARKKRAAALLELLVSGEYVYVNDYYKKSRAMQDLIEQGLVTTQLRKQVSHIECFVPSFAVATWPEDPE